MSGSTTDPAGVLTEPSESEGSGGSFDLVGAVTQIAEWASPTYWFNTAVSVCFGFDPLERLSELLVGDWKGLYRCDSTLKNLAQCARYMVQNMSTGNTAVFQQWQGEAAASAQSYFTSLAADVTQHATQLDSAAAQYGQMAGVYEAEGKAIIGVVEVLVDVLILLAVTVAAGGATAESGAGPVLAGAAAIGEIAEAIDKWTEILTLIAKIDAAAKAASAVLQALLVNIHQFTTVSLPRGAYDNPEVS